MENATLIAAVIGFVELYKRAVDKDYKTAGLIVVAGLAGALFASQIPDTTWFMGMLAGFGASGVITAVTRVGGSK